MLYKLLCSFCRKGFDVEEKIWNTGNKSQHPDGRWWVLKASLFVTLSDNPQLTLFGKNSGSELFWVEKKVIREIRSLVVR
jgi:hypothetical protein